MKAPLINKNAMLTAQIIFKARELIQNASEFYSISVPFPQFDFSLRGQCAGQMVGTFAGRSFISGVCRINTAFFEQYFDAFLNEVLPHEIAHLVVMVRFGRSKRIKPHGKEWQAVMWQCFGKIPKIYHDFQLAHEAKSPPKKRTMRYHDYVCGCSDHKLSQVRHNRYLKGVQYSCTTCGQMIQPKNA